MSGRHEARSTTRDAAWRGLAVFILVASAGLLWLGGAGSLRAAQRMEAFSKGQAAPESFACSFRRRTGQPCPGCGGTEAFGHAAGGRWREAAGANPLGAFAGLAAWALAAAGSLTAMGAGSGWVRRTAAAVIVLLPLAFVVNAAVWWTSLPPGALR